MRDLLHDLADAGNPMEAARSAARPALRARFYAEVTTEQTSEGLHQVLLDGRPIRTPARRSLAIPTPALAGALAAEWNAQRDVINPARMPLTRLANTIIDGVSEALEATATDVAKYLASDLVFYRADKPEALVARQAALWDPLLAWMREAFGARFVLSEGVTFVTQPDAALAAARAAIPADAWRLGALHAITTLTGSAVIALAVLHGRLSTQEAWSAAHVDENWNWEQWGEDTLAVQQRDYRWQEMQAAAAILEFGALAFPKASGRPA